MIAAVAPFDRRAPGIIGGTTPAAITGSTVTSTGQLVISGASAGQIVFPASQNASANVNTLDDYEEGTFTPTFVSSGGGTPTYSFQNGTYTKIGDRVLITCSIGISALNTLAAGTLTIAGLPFTTKNASARYVYATFVFNLATTAITQIMSSSINNVTDIQLWRYASGTNTQMTVSDISGTAQIYLSGQYET